MSDFTAGLSELLHDVKLRSTGAHRFDRVADRLCAELRVETVRCVFISGKKQVSPRMSTPGITKLRPDLVLAVYGHDLDDGGLASAIRNAVVVEDSLNVVLIAKEPVDGGEFQFQRVFFKAGTDAAGLTDRHVPDADFVEIAGAGVLRPRGEVRAGSVVVDDRIRRVLRSAFASSRAVMLVGPPGTGKTTLVQELLEEAIDDPARFGLSVSPARGPVVTPDESWTITDFVGGPTLEDGHLVFRAGHLLQSILDDRVIVVDEANRADLDKLLGPILTWLSGGEVVVGRVNEKSDSPQVVLDWAEGAASAVQNQDLLGDREASGSDPVRFSAGRDWRLIGTYNAVDAHRVFRFGEALGRRFATVPVPPPDPTVVADLLEQLSSGLGLPDEVADTVAGLFEAHAGAANTVLGPAAFLDVPPFVWKAGRLDPDAPMIELVAEAYISRVGLTLAKFEEDELDDLQARAIDLGGLDQDQWDWIRDNIRPLRG